MFCLLPIFIFTNKTQYDQALTQVMKDRGLEKCVALPESHSWSAIQRSLMEAIDNAVVNIEPKNKVSFTAKQCRDRWLNHLRPGIIKGNWTIQEKELIIQMSSSEK